MTTIYRQGDVMLMRVDSLPPGAKKEEVAERIVLAYGEVTGHAHALDTALAVAYSHNEGRFLEAHEGATVRHEEHGPIELPPGYYKVVQQREYTPQEIRRVID